LQLQLSARLIVDECPGNVGACREVLAACKALNNWNILLQRKFFHHIISGLVGMALRFAKMSRLKIDGARFCRNLSTMARSIGVDGLPRLVELGCHSAEVTYSVAGGTNDMGRQSLELCISGRFMLTCQRCLKPMQWGMTSRIDLELVSSQEAIDNAIDDRDRVLAGKEMDVDALIEDEIILAIPMIPHHDDCLTTKAVLASEVASPFGVLALLKRGAARD